MGWEYVECKPCGIGNGFAFRLHAFDERLLYQKLRVDRVWLTCQHDLFSQIAYVFEIKNNYLT